MSQLGSLVTLTTTVLVEFKERGGFKQGHQKKSKADKLTVISVSHQPPKSLDEVCSGCVPQRQILFQGASDHRERGRNPGTGIEWQSCSYDPVGSCTTIGGQLFY